MDRPLEESELVERAKRGDAVAYGELVRAHQQLAFRTAYLITGDAGEAEEAAQDGFVKAYRALARFRSGEPFRPWVLRIVGNEAKNRRTSAARRANLALRAAEESRSGGAVPSPETALLDADRRERLLGAIGNLRDEERDVIACRVLLGLSEEETAAALSLRKGTVKSRTSRALAHMREEVESD